MTKVVCPDGKTKITFPKDRIFITDEEINKACSIAMAKKKRKLNVSKIDRTNASSRLKVQGVWF